MVTTAWHEVGIKVRIHCDTLLQIEGFNEEDVVREFIFKYFKDNKNLAEKLVSKLESDKNLTEMAANPPNTVLLCFICEEFQAGYFPREYCMWKSFNVSLEDTEKKKELPKTRKDFIEVYSALLKHLGHIVLNGLHKHNLDSTEKSVSTCCMMMVTMMINFISVSSLIAGHIMPTNREH